MGDGVGASITEGASETAISGDPQTAAFSRRKRASEAVKGTGEILPFWRFDDHRGDDDRLVDLRECG